MTAKPRDSSPSTRDRRSPRRKRRPMKATDEALERAAQRYLERYETASGHLRRLLLAKVTLSARLYGTDPEAGTAAVERLLQRFLKAGVLDDRRFAETRLRSLRAKGCSQAMIRARLGAKGIATALIDEVLATESGRSEASDLAAALTYAKRRRLGPFRLEDRPARRERDLATLGRQGFDYQTAKKVIDCTDPEALQAELSLD